MSADNIQAERLLREQIMDMSAVIWPQNDAKITFLSRQDRNHQNWMYWANLVGRKPTTTVLCPGNLWTESTLLSTEALFRQMGLEMGHHLGEDWLPHEY